VRAWRGDNTGAALALLSEREILRGNLPRRVGRGGGCVKDGLEPQNVQFRRSFGESLCTRKWRERSRVSSFQLSSLRFTRILAPG
jgi:hypothetical protein